MKLVVNQISKSYKRGKQEIWPLKEVTFIPEPGIITVIQGKSGAGKSTLIKMILGLEQGLGTITIDGKNIEDYGEKEFARLRNQRIGYVDQNGEIIHSLNVWDNVRLTYALYDGIHEDGEKYVKELLERLDIEALAEEYVDTLSGGERRRVAIARALTNKPDLIIADEPTNDLDRESTQRVIECFKQEAKRGAIVLIVTHDQQLVDEADKVFLLSDGCIREC